MTDPGQDAIQLISSTATSSGDPGGRPPLAHEVAFVLVVLTPVVTMLLPPYVGGLAAKNLAFLTLAYTSLVFTLCGRSTRQAVPVTPTTLGLILMLVAGVISTIAAGLPDVTVRSLGFLGALVALHVAAAATITTERRFAVFAAAGALAAVMVAVVGIRGLFDFQDAVAAGIANETHRSRYLATPFFEHSYLAVQAVLPSILVAAGFLMVRGRARHPRNDASASRRVRSNAWRVAAALVLILPLAFLGAVFSRGAWIAFAAAIFVVLISAVYRYAHARRIERGGPRGSPLRWLIPCAIAVLGAVAVVLVAANEGSFGPTAQAALARVGSLLDPDLRMFNFSRLLVWQDALRIAGDAAPIGVGPGHFSHAFGAIHAGHKPLSHAHNQLLHTFAELGALGLVGLCLTLLHAAIGAISEFAHTGAKSQHRVALAVLGATTVIVVLSGFESPLLFPAVAAQFAAITGAGARLVGGPVRVGSGWLHGRRLLWTRATAAVLLIALLIAVGPSIWHHTRASQLGAEAHAASDGGDLELASTLAREALRFTPEHAEVLALLGQLRVAAGDPEGAQDAFGKYLAAAPGQSEALFHRALALRSLRRFEEAVSLLQIAQHRAPQEAASDIRFVLGQTLFQAKRFEEARLLFADLVRQNAHGKDPTLFLRFSETLMNLGRDRALATQLLQLYTKVVTGAKSNYARSLLEDIERFYPRDTSASPPPNTDDGESADGE